jgi:hypothetical protein
MLYSVISFPWVDLCCLWALFGVAHRQIQISARWADGGSIARENARIVHWDDRIFRHDPHPGVLFHLLGEASG